MPSSGGRFSQFQKDYLKQLIVECEVQRFTVEESMAYIKERLKDEISVEHFYYMKRQIKKNLGTRLSYLRKDRTAFIAEIFFRRVTDISLTMGSLSYTFCAVVLGSIFFGSFTIILSTKIKTSEAHNVINTSLFLFFAFVSSAFYPTQGLPESLSIASYFNPLTYVVNITREGIFSQVDEFTNIEIFILTLFSSSAFIIATRLIAKMHV